MSGRSGVAESRLQWRISEVVGRGSTGTDLAAEQMELGGQLKRDGDGPLRPVAGVGAAPRRAHGLEEDAAGEHVLVLQPPEQRGHLRGLVEGLAVEEALQLQRPPRLKVRARREVRARVEDVVVGVDAPDREGGRREDLRTRNRSEGRAAEGVRLASQERGNAQAFQYESNKRSQQVSAREQSTCKTQQSNYRRYYSIHHKTQSANVMCRRQYTLKCRPISIITEGV